MQGYRINGGKFQLLSPGEEEEGGREIP